MKPSAAISVVFDRLSMTITSPPSTFRLPVPVMPAGGWMRVLTLKLPRLFGATRLTFCASMTPGPETVPLLPVVMPMPPLELVTMSALMLMFWRTLLIEMPSCARDTPSLWRDSSLAPIVMLRPSMMMPPVTESASVLTAVLEVELTVTVAPGLIVTLPVEVSSLPSPSLVIASSLISGRVWPVAVSAPTTRTPSCASPWPNTSITARPLLEVALMLPTVLMQTSLCAQLATQALREPDVMATSALCGAEPAAVAGPLSVTVMPAPGNMVTGPLALVRRTPALTPLLAPPPVAVMGLLMRTPELPLMLTLAAATLPRLVAVMFFPAGSVTRPPETMLIVAAPLLETLIDSAMTTLLASR